MGSGAFFYFSNEHKNVFSQNADPMRTKFAMEHEIDDFNLRDFARHLEPLSGACCNLSANPTFSLKILYSKTKAVNTEIDGGNCTKSTYYLGATHMTGPQERGVVGLPPDPTLPLNILHNFRPEFGRN